jgi:hypothetical protein
MNTNDNFNKNDKQIHFNQVKGVIFEINNDTEFCSLTLELGHENTRYANLVCKKGQFNPMMEGFKIGDKVSVRYYITSRKKLDRWYTAANMLSVHKD